MTTADEIRVKYAEALPYFDAMQKVIAETLSDSALLRLCGREVCARRARKLRKRGDLVRWMCSTSNGKSRYRWMKRIDINLVSNKVIQGPLRGPAGMEGSTT